MKRIGGACALILVGAALAAERAEACRCAVPDVRSELGGTDGAFVGRLIEKRRRTDSEASYIFSVERGVKGSFGSIVEVISAAHSAACGIGVQPGRRIGLFVKREGPYLRSSLCWQVDPDELLAAARPLPRPNGRPPAVVLVGGRSGDVRTMALDGRGRTLAYGRGAGQTSLLAVCPGGRRAVEVTVAPSGAKLGVRELPRLRLVRETPLLLGDYSPKSLCCGDARASRVVLFALDRTTIEFRGRVISVDPDVRVVWSGDAFAASFDRAGSRAYLSAGKRGTALLTLRLADGHVGQTATLPAFTGPLTPSPDGTHLAGVANPSRYEASSPTARSSLVLVRPSGAVSTAPLEPYADGQVAWWRSRPVFLPSTSGRIVVHNLETGGRRQLGRWPAWLSALHGDTAYGVALGRLYAVDLRSGQLRVVRRLASTVTGALAVVPGRPKPA